MSDLVRLKYGYDQASNRLFRRDEVARTNSAKFDELYGYDGLHRLTAMDRGELNATNTALSGAPTLTQDWTLDATGNWKGFDQTVLSPLVQTRTHNPVNEITNINETVGASWATPAYDANGNTTTLPWPKDLTKGYKGTYDAWNRLVKLETDDAVPKKVAEYGYDGLNRRTAKKTYDSAGVLQETRLSFYSDQWQTLEERVGSSVNPERQFVWGQRYVDDLVLRDRDTNGDGTLDEWLYALSDALFNVVALMNSSGAVQERYAYEPYGASQVLTPAFANRTSSSFDWEYRFTGRQYDEESGLQINRNRFLHLHLGRWISRDPLEIISGASLYYAYFVPGTVDPSGLHDLPITDTFSVPDLKVKVEASPDVTYKKNRRQFTVPQIRNIRRGTELGSTRGGGDIEFQYAYGPVTTKEITDGCPCGDGSKKMLVYIDSMTLKVKYPILVTTLEWTNPPANKVAEWQRLAAAILAHEQHHVDDIIKRLTQMSRTYTLNGKAGLPHEHIFRVFCTGTLTREKSIEIGNALKKDAKDAALELFGVLNEILNRAVESDRAAFHRTPEGQPINVRDYITP